MMAILILLKLEKMIIFLRIDARIDEIHQNWRSPFKLVAMSASVASSSEPAVAVAAMSSSEPAVAMETDAIAEETEPAWRRDGHRYVGLRIARSHESEDGDVATSAALVVGWLSADESDFVDDDGVAAPLFRVRYEDGELEGDEEDLEEHEVAASLEGESSDDDASDAADVADAAAAVSSDDAADASGAARQQRLIDAYVQLEAEADDALEALEDERVDAVRAEVLAELAAGGDDPAGAAAHSQVHRVTVWISEGRNRDFLIRSEHAAISAICDPTSTWEAWRQNIGRTRVHTHVAVVEKVPTQHRQPMSHGLAGVWHLGGQVVELRRVCGDVEEAPMRAVQ